MAQWKTIPIYEKLQKNVGEKSLRGESVASAENLYTTEEGTLSRFPQLQEYLDLPVTSDVYLHKCKGDMIASCGGRTYRVDVVNDSFQDVTGALVNGSGRTIFSKTEDGLLMAAGGKIIKLAGDTTSILSPDAPETTHVAWLAGLAVALEKGSNRFNYSGDTISDWPALNVLSAEGNPDNINSLIVSEFGDELFVGGEETIEQFDLQGSGDAPLVYRWGLPSGLLAPYTLISVDNRLWGVNQHKEFQAYSGGVGQTESDDIQKVLDGIQDWTGAWTSRLKYDGQRFIILQIPKAINEYGSEGITLLYQYKMKRWYYLYSFDQEPILWKGRSYLEFNGQHYVGGEGKIYKLVKENGLTQKFLWRSGHLSVSSGNDVQLDRIRFCMKRGQAALGTVAPILSLRIRKNGRNWGRKVRISLGITGERFMNVEFAGLGTAKNFQFELDMTDGQDLELVRASLLINELGN